MLVYFKPVVYGNESRVVVHYKPKNPLSPQQPTSDQFFGESQFESYRRLGEFAGNEVCGPLPPQVDKLNWSVDFLKHASRHCGDDSQRWLLNWIVRRRFRDCFQAFMNGR